MSASPRIGNKSIFCRLRCYVFLLFLKPSQCFQVAPDPNQTFKQAIEKATKAKEISVIAPLPLIPVDDKTYSPRISRDDFETTLNVPLSDKLRLQRDCKDKFITALPLINSGIIKHKYVPPRRNGVVRKRFGYDDMPSEYWFNNKIHSLGNTGVSGWIHAAIAPLATKIIDNSAYNGEDVRTRVSKALKKSIDKQNVRILDLCCGVGMSTRALASAFKENAEIIVGVDTSPEMIAMARNIMKYQEIQDIVKKFKISSNVVSDIQSLIQELQYCLLQPVNQIYTKAMSAKWQMKQLLFAQGNAERVKVAANSFDLVTIMYAFHEIPKSARYRILREARRLLKDGGKLAIVDISTDYCPSPSMLAGEPYVLEYQQNIMQQMQSLQGFSNATDKVVVQGHVHMWELVRCRRN